MEELRIEYLPLDALKPYSRNAKKHPDEQVEHIANSIREFGFRQPLVIDRDGVLVIGHGRLLAAKKLGLKTVPCVRADDLTDEQVKALRLADNKTNESAWDDELLNLELDDILNLDMSDFGFGLKEPAGVNEVEEDGYQLELPEVANAKLGDKYQLGDHILLCGDSTDKETVVRLMGDDKAKLLFTSPPYSNMRDYEGGKNLDVSGLSRFIFAYKDFAEYMAVNLGIQRKEEQIVQYWDEYIDAAHAEGLKLLAWNVWDKMQCGSVGQHSAMVPIRHEWIFVFGEKAANLNLTWLKKKSSIYARGSKRTVRQKDGSTKTSTRGDTSSAFKKMESVLKIPEKDSIDSVTEQVAELGAIRKKHPATFPIYLPAEYIIAFTDEGNVVVEPFGGSGTTLMACEELGRKCRIMELEPKYVDVIIDRWEQFTGKKAVLLNG